MALAMANLYQNHVFFLHRVTMNDFQSKEQSRKVTLKKCQTSMLINIFQFLLFIFAFLCTQNPRKN